LGGLFCEQHGLSRWQHDDRGQQLDLLGGCGNVGQERLPSIQTNPNQKSRPRQRSSAGTRGAESLPLGAKIGITDV
jgi:hypothetical protein